MNPLRQAELDLEYLIWIPTLSRHLQPGRPSSLKPDWSISSIMDELIWNVRPEGTLYVSTLKDRETTYKLFLSEVHLPPQKCPELRTQHIPQAIYSSNSTALSSKGCSCYLTWMLLTPTEAVFGLSAGSSTHFQSLWKPASVNKLVSYSSFSFIISIPVSCFSAWEARQQLGN